VKIVSDKSNSPVDYPALFEAYRDAATAVISDNLDREPGAVGIRPFHRCEATMVGRALTVRTRAGDNAVIHRALCLVRPGDVVVVDGGGDTSRALVGEIMAAIARSRGAVGLVLDGAIRDVTVIAADTFPVFAKAAIHRGPYKNGPGEIGVPVSVGGMLVCPGDLVVGDADGVVAMSPAVAARIHAAVVEQERKEREILASIANGTYVDAYGR
jgi:regulator of RNase E activity RraA